MKKLLLFAFVLPVIVLQAQNREKNYDFVDQCICGLSKVSKSGLIGYMDKQGAGVIKPQYTEGLTFSEGLLGLY